MAKTQQDLPWDQKLYTDQVKQLLIRCNFPEFENIKKEIESYEDKTPNWFEASSLHREVDFQVSLFQFEKGEYIPHHDHPDMTGVINVVSGSILTKNYSVEEQLSSTREVVKNGRTEVMGQRVIREVGNDVFSGGHVSILTADEGNIHSIMPNEYTQLVDVFTPAYTPETTGTWYTVDEDGFYQGRDNLFTAEYQIEGLSEINTVKVSKKTLDQYVGTYRVSDTNFIKTSRDGKQLILERTRSLDSPGMKMNLLPYEQNKFWIEGQDARCIFNEDNAQVAPSLTFFFKEISMTATRIEVPE